MVAVAVGLIRVGDRRTVVDVAAHAVPVDVVLRVERTRVARVAQSVAVGVGLIRVGDGRAVVDQAAHAVPVGVVRGVERADIAGIAERVSVGVRLVRVRDRGAVVDVPANPVAVDVVVLVERAGHRGHRQGRGDDRLALLVRAGGARRVGAVRRDRVVGRGAGARRDALVGPLGPSVVPEERSGVTADRGADRQSVGRDAHRRGERVGGLAGGRVHAAGHDRGALFDVFEGRRREVRGRRGRPAVGHDERGVGRGHDPRLFEVPQLDPHDRGRARGRAVDPGQALAAKGHGIDGDTRSILVTDHEDQESIASGACDVRQSGGPRPDAGRDAGVAHAVPIGVLLAGVRDLPAVIAGVTLGVAIRVDLARVRDRRAVVADIAPGVPVGVLLVRIRDRGAVVAGVAPRVAVAVCLGRVHDRGTVVTRIAQGVAVGVDLIRVRDRRAGVARVPSAIAVAVELVRVRERRTVVAGVARGVAVSVGLTRVGNRDAVVAGVAKRVAVGVELVRVRDRRAGVAAVTPAVGVGVELVHVGERRAVVDVAAYAVAIGIVRRVERTRVARVALRVAIGVGLVGVRDRRAIVDAAAHRVAIGVVRDVLRARVARIALRVAVRIELVRVGDRRAIVDAAAHPVSVGVVENVEGARVAGVAEAVSVGVGLVGVRDRGAVVDVRAHGVAVGVELVGVGEVRTPVAGVTDAISVRVELRGIGDRRADVVDVGRSVAVKVHRRIGRAGGSLRPRTRACGAEVPVAARVAPRDEVVQERAGRGNRRVARAAPGNGRHQALMVVDERLTGRDRASVEAVDVPLCRPVPLQRALVRFGSQAERLAGDLRGAASIGRAIAFVGDRVSVPVRVAEVAEPVSIEVALTGVDDQRTVVARVAHAVAIPVGSVERVDAARRRVAAVVRANAAVVAGDRGARVASGGAVEHGDRVDVLTDGAEALVDADAPLQSNRLPRGGRREVDPRREIGGVAGRVPGPSRPAGQGIVVTVRQHAGIPAARKTPACGHDVGERTRADGDLENGSVEIGASGGLEAPAVPEDQGRRR